MRLSHLAAMAACFVSCGLAIAGDEPYEAFVVADEAEVYAGPSKRFYATAKLPFGTSVEVYRRDAGGFLAIRPPEGSFSWIPAEHLEMTDEPNVGRVIADEAASWIGTNLERVREHKFHVQLKAGELVEVLGKRTVDSEDGQGQVWLKIAPPAGEFRWIHSAETSRDKPEEIPEPVEAEEPREIVKAARDVEVEEPREEDVQTPRDEPRRFIKPRSSIKLTDIHQQPRASVKQASYNPPVDATVDHSPAGDGFVSRNRNRLNPAISSHTAPQAMSKTSLKTAQKSEGLSTASQGPMEAAEFTREMESLDVDLGLMLAQSKQTWNLAPLKQRANRLVEGGPTPADRGRARLLADKIREIEMAFDVPEITVAAEPIAAPGITPVAGASQADPKYDGTGFLKPVIAQGKPLAPYALVDGDGNTRCYLTPTPGLNLHRYVNKEVGIYGRRGVIETLRSPHITAERVIDLQRHRR